MSNRDTMKVVILCGGMGTRIRDVNELLPKPMIPIGAQPILWHLMKYYAHFGFKDFLLCLGYKREAIIDYFLRYRYHNADLTLELGRETAIQLHERQEPGEDWRVTLADTGLRTQTGARLKRASKYLDGARLLLTYGDGLASIDIAALLASHERSGKLATVSAVHPAGRFGEIEVADGDVLGFNEKPQTSTGFINGGFMVLEREFIDRYLSDDETCVLETDGLQRCAREGELNAYCHEGFWQCMDTAREHQMLEEMWNTGRAPWQVWEQNTSQKTNESAPPASGGQLSYSLSEHISDLQPAAQKTQTPRFRAEKIDRCRICSAENLEPILDFGETALANRFLRPEEIDVPEPFFPLRLMLCGTCGLVQLDVNVPRELLFKDYIYVSGTSDLVHKHARWLVSTLSRRYRLDPSDLIVEAASNDGTVLKAFRQQGFRVLGVEPAGNIAALARAAGIPTAEEFFDESVARQIRKTAGPAGFFLARHVLAHVTDLHGFAAGIRDVLGPHGIAAVECPHLAPMYRKLEFDQVYHEHLCYYSARALGTLFARHGLKIIDIDKVAIHGGSILVHLAHEKSPHQATSRVAAVFAEEDDLQLSRSTAWRRFAEQVESWREQMLLLLDHLRARGLSLAGYGAAAKGNSLLAYCGLTTREIPFLVDKSPHKQGLLTPGSHIPVLPVQELLSRQPDATLILAWNFAGEIVKQQAEYQRRGGRFIVPIPSPKLLASRHDRRRTYSSPVADPG